MHRIILASQSPRRKELLSLIEKDFSVITADIDERSIEEEVLKKHDDMIEAGKEMTVLLGKTKAEAVFESLEDKENVIVIGADTCVVTKDEILGKPADREDCVRMLTKLTGAPHYVITGVSLVSKDKTICFYDESEVLFNDMDGYQKMKIEEYADTKEPYDKAGAYGIQGKGSMLIKKLNGDFYNVMGLPVSRLAKELWQF
ncbi:MAG: septum formation protein Maf [Clostridiales bacterium]|nr:septum formation protein Maf [Clostridiales bacterium]